MISEKIYEEIQKLDFNGIKEFYRTEIKPLRFNTAILGKKENLDMDAVNKMGVLKSQFKRYFWTLDINI
ncbi:hypothetical protein AAEU33_00035 [Chryseobacterium sp. Chry.R1]|uniref:hypothetical protein n=1 Tax=Chryseobacterium sp. Chry.R1 TaxID=3139392 RepID=UPI0031F83D1B